MGREPSALRQKLSALFMVFGSKLNNLMERNQRRVPHVSVIPQAPFHMKIQDISFVTHLETNSNGNVTLAIVLYAINT